ncbi:MAG TPA: hypothetical protein DEA40_01840 [Parvularcula sp.]|nr:hypothetical protein [Parvularcula sp.]
MSRALRRADQSRPKTAPIAVISAGAASPPITAIAAAISAASAPPSQSPAASGAASAATARTLAAA